MSHHLKILTRAGLVTFRREGTHIFYRRVSDGGDALRGAILAALDAAPLADDILARIRAVEDARAAASRSHPSRQSKRYGANHSTILCDARCANSSSIARATCGHCAAISRPIPIK